jgi:uncharacterized protein (TIGR00255 family)
MRSMTGYGKGIAEADGKKITIEIKTVNHRYLDFGLKFPKTFLFLEDAMKKQIGKELTRGHIDMYLTYEQTECAKGGYQVDFDLLDNYLSTAKQIAEMSGLSNDVTVSSLIRNGDIVTRAESSEDETLLAELTCKALENALNALVDARNKEGATIKADLESKLDNMQNCLDKIKGYAPTVVADYKEKLTARIAELIDGSVDESRIATEVAIFADKCCIDEEITRLGAHIDLMRKTLVLSKPIGRDLDFRVQEMNRETNTIGSKANDLRITEEVLALKNEIEKLREQAQNVE